MAERWGVIADDVTGACDVAAELRELGLAVAVVLGVPAAEDVPDDVDVVVVGLGTRTAPREKAVAESVSTAEALRAAGAGRWYQKYCSTFDSTDDGMIGPVAEALVAAGALAGSAGTPATPHADRTVYRGHLFVGDRLLSESPLAHHPLTPMTDPDLVRVLGRQTSGTVGLVPLPVVRGGAAAVSAALGDAPADHLLLDALDDGDLDILAVVLDDPTLPRRLPGGGAGLMTAFGRRLVVHSQTDIAEPVEPGPGIVLAGSASAQTRAQLADAGGATVSLDAVAASEDRVATVQNTVTAVRHELAAGRTPIVSAGHDPDAVAAAQEQLGVAAAADAVEAVLADVARAAVDTLGVRRLLIAGGETSGAVTRVLGLRALRLTRRVDPGVAWATGRATLAADAPVLAVLLKSGNFGGVDLFTRAWRMAP